MRSSVPDLRLVNASSASPSGVLTRSTTSSLGTSAPAPDRAPWNSDVARIAVEAAGLRVLRAEDAYPITRFHDVGAIAYYLNAVAWAIPDFTVDRYAETLLVLHRQVERTGQPPDVGFHLFLLVAERTTPG
jgi:hypothetical protein